MTNFDKIKQMSAEDFTKKRHLLECASCDQLKNGADPTECTKKAKKWWNTPCDECFLKWLESEVEE